MSDFKINTEEAFEHLPNAPIREALIDFRARATMPWHEDVLRGALERKLPDYPTVDLQSSLILGFKLNLPASVAETKQEQSWKGFQFKSGDRTQVATFDRDGFTFSRLAPYQNWEKFESETLHLWALHVDIAKPDQIERMGVRFINRIPLPPREVDVGDFINPCPKEPKGLETLIQTSFLHIDTYQVPNYPYTLNITRTIDQGVADSAGAIQSWGLILDIDVSTLQPADVGDLERIKRRLNEMRWLKNKAFFGSITELSKKEAA